MRDEADHLTIELPGVGPVVPRRGRGRPPKPDALTPAERSRRWRERHRQDLRAQSRPAQVACAEREIASVLALRRRHSSSAEVRGECIGVLRLAVALGLITRARRLELFEEL